MSAHNRLLGLCLLIVVMSALGIAQVLNDNQKIKTAAEIQAGSSSTSWLPEFLQ